MKAWDTHPWCTICLTRRTKDGLCAQCAIEARSSKKKRTGWDPYFMAIATQVATRATCLRKHVGAVLVRERTVLSTGYNGSVRGMAHCTEVGCMMDEGHCVRTVHAEANAIVQAAKNGMPIDGATIYTTASPCWWCFKLIVNSGVKQIVFGELYRDDRITDFSKEADIKLVHLPDPHAKKEAKKVNQQATSGVPRGRKKAVPRRGSNRDRR